PFAKAMAQYARRHDVNIPTSYRTLANYLSERTRPSVAWVDAAAAVLRQSPQYLISGLESSRPSEQGTPGLKTTLEGPEATRADALVHLVFNEYLDLPPNARDMMWRFVNCYYGDDIDGWHDWSNNPRRPAEVAAVVRDHYGPLLAAPRMGELEATALAATLTAAAYLRLIATTKGRAS
ncbi:MAG TPA: hypothetical protein VMM79_05795, partial [Longimicrobiales bacterium]|nr:hypothetical protein [Longimicrobiales bacterium]